MYPLLLFYGFYFFRPFRYKALHCVDRVCLSLFISTYFLTSINKVFPNSDKFDGSVPSES